MSVETCLPIEDKGLEQTFVLRGTSHVGTSLIPKETADGHIKEGSHHRIVEVAGIPRVVGALGLRVVVGNVVFRHALLTFPGTRQREACLAVHQFQVLALTYETTFTSRVKDAHGDKVAPCLNQSAGDDILTFVVPTIGGSHTFTVPIGHILVVDFPQTKFHVVASPVGRHIDDTAEPHNAIPAREFVRTPSHGLLHCLPVCIAEVGGSPQGTFGVSRFQPLVDAKHASLPGSVFFLEESIYLTLVETRGGNARKVFFETCHTAQAFVAHPGFGRCSAPRTVDHTYGDSQFLRYLACKEIGSCRETFRHFGRAHSPPIGVTIRHLGLRRVSHFLLHLEEAYQGMIGILHLLLPVAHRSPVAVQGHLHIRLSAAKPHLARHHVVQHHLLTVVEGQGIGTSSLRNTKVKQEDTCLFVCLDFRGLVVPRGCNLHRSTLLCGAL